MIQYIVHLRSVVSKNSHPVFAEGMWLGRDCIYFMTHPCSFLRSLSGMVEWFGFGNEANFETVVERMCYCWEEFTGCHRPVSVPFPGEGTLLGYGRHGPAASDNFYLYPLSSTYQLYIPSQTHVVFPQPWREDETTTAGLFAGSISSLGEI